MARKVYHVVPDASGGWSVKSGGKTVSRHVTKDDGVRAARKKASARAPSEVIIHRPDGTIEMEAGYGKDPFPRS